jgi:hypothetical protein
MRRICSMSQTLSPRLRLQISRSEVCKSSGQYFRNTSRLQVTRNENVKRLEHIASTLASDKDHLAPKIIPSSPMAHPGGCLHRFGNIMR